MRVLPLDHLSQLLQGSFLRSLLYETQSGHPCERPAALLWRCCHDVSSLRMVREAPIPCRAAAEAGAEVIHFPVAGEE